MIDTHCHLTDPRILAQLPGVLRRCAEAGVDRLVSIGTDLEDDRATIELCRRLPNARCAIGIHPNYSAAAKVEDVEQLRAMAAEPGVFALGEMGLDYHYDRAPVDHQRAIFVAQLQLAKELDRPVVIHCREAVDDALALMKEFSPVTAVFHCFTGLLDEAKRIIDAGYLIGFDGPITYKKNDDLREVVRFVPIDRILVETDAPYLTPEPVRKIKTNEPAFVTHVARMVGDVKRVSYDEIDRITTENALRFYRWNT
jgi:TatD DNase family protein